MKKVKVGKIMRTVGSPCESDSLKKMASSKRKKHVANHEFSILMMSVSDTFVNQSNVSKKD